MIQVTIGQASQGFWSPQIVAAIITGGVAIITGSLVAFFAWRQWRTAKDKLALDLFDRRFTAYHALLDAMTAREREIDKTKTYRYMTTNKEDQPSFEMSHLFRRRGEDFSFLFGPDVFQVVTEIAVNLAAQLTVHKRLVEANYDMKIYDEYEQKQVELESLRRKLRDAVRPYMMLNKIAVNRPAKATRAQGPL